MNKKQFDLILKGGHVIDPKNDVSKVMDVAVADGRVAALAVDMPASKAKEVVDVSGYYVTPGLIDIHVHVYPECCTYGVVADAHSFCSGVTTMVDAGTSGAANFGDFKERWIDRSKTRILTLLNIVDTGMIDFEREQDVSRMNPEITAGFAAAYPETIVGIKLAHFWTWQPWDATHKPWDNVRRAVKAGELCQKPVMADFWPRDPERSYADLILRELRPGDIHTHVFAQQFPIIDEQGKLNPIMREARARGVIFDLGHGMGSFWYRNAARAKEQGFLPDSFGTDLHNKNISNGLVIDTLNVMSKFLAMGVSLEEVIRRTTANPARQIGHMELGNLDVGAEADIAVLDLREGEFGFIDCGRGKILGDKKLECMMTLRRGEIVFDPNGVTMPEWQAAPEDYWVCQPPTGAPGSSRLLDPDKFAL